MYKVIEKTTYEVVHQETYETLAIFPGYEKPKAESLCTFANEIEYNTRKKLEREAAKNDSKVAPTTPV